MDVAKDVMRPGGIVGAPVHFERADEENESHASQLLRNLSHRRIDTHGRGRDNELARLNAKRPAALGLRLSKRNDMVGASEEPAVDPMHPGSYVISPRARTGDD